MTTSSTKQLILGSALVLAGLTAGAVDAMAGGDVNYGAGLARHQAAVPVPAPIPVPETSSGYYLRVDAAYARGDVSKYRTTDPHADSIRADSYLDNHARYGFGAGYYFNSWLRGDITFDQRGDVESRGNGIVNYTLPNGNLGNSAMRDTFTANSLTSSNSTGLVNAYVDIPVRPGFTPYVGAGIGYVRHQVKALSYGKTTDCTDIVDCDPTAVITAGPQNGPTVTTTGGGVDYGLALALMTGFSYNITTNGKLDIGYRWLHLEGTKVIGRTAGVVHNLTIPDQNLHELRVGLRYDIN